ncbi:hypothetical protein G6F56_005430 [Rhizopus delemar]|uniref:Zn(2)-C6 fungal-type domain-containing protein n=1 Tax=Rhizopus stolonifer TaxID=4846 RepID=A0A367J0S1_RHIST|nr:hypothetical protein G6F56_005430 [Rhizopus delemar]RCH83524.1 hypothetical protein CU098_001355 [Rhizopus stolonifer]
MSSKKVPCEECRNQKRKCNNQQPCERCFKFGLDCEYVVLLSPMDEEFIQIAMQKELQNQVKTLETEIKGMEMEIRHLKDPGATPSPTLSTPSLTDDSDGSVIHDFSVSSPPYPSLSKKPNQQLIAISKDGTCAILKSDKERRKESTNAKPWTLCVKKGNFCIDTNIKNHSDMLDNLYHMLQSFKYGLNIPPEFNDFVVRDALVKELNVLIRKKYGKVHCKNVAKSVRIFVTPNIPNIGTVTVARSLENIQVTTDRLIHAYLSCQHYQQLAIHVPTFANLFLGTRDSAAAMGLCATICTLRCKHVAGCLPSASLVEYGKFYFERARDTISDSFDQFNLETFTTYVFMAIYKLTVSEPNEGKLYIDMAERISTVLKPRYTSPSKKKGEAVHFSRLLNHLHRVLTYEEISRAFPQAEDTSLPYCMLTHSQEGKWEIAEDDTEQERRFAQMHTYILRLQRTEREASRNVYSSNLFRLIDLIGHQVEMSMKHWYSKVLPADFRLSLPLFDSNVSCEKFNATLERECAESPIPILTTLAIYEEWIIMGQSYLPKGLPQPENEWHMLKTFWKGGKLPSDISSKWKKRIQKLIDLRRRIDFDGTDEEYFETIECLWSSTDSHMNSHIIIAAVHSAFITVRLVRYLRSRSADCFFDMRVLVNAWQLLLVVSKIQTMMPPEIIQIIPRVHKYLAICLSIVHDELKFQPYQGKVSDFVESMEREFKSQTVEEECECVACPNA